METLAPLLVWTLTAYLVVQFGADAYLRAAVLVLSGVVLYGVRAFTRKGQD